MLIGAGAAEERSGCGGTRRLWKTERCREYRRRERCTPDSLKGCAVEISVREVFLLKIKMMSPLQKCHRSMHYGPLKNLEVKCFYRPLQKSAMLI